ncbi:MAG: NAD(P)-binding protein [Candidatus Micrarchaeota archaeon]
MNRVIRSRNTRILIAFIGFLVVATVLCTAALVYFEGVDFDSAFYWVIVSEFLSAHYLVFDNAMHERLTLKILTIVTGITYLIIVSFLIAQFVNMLSHVSVRETRMKRKLASVSGHFIVCGYGKTGEKVCEKLDESNVEYVVVDSDKMLDPYFKEHEITHVIGDATSSKTLEKAGIKRAKAVISTLGDDSLNVFVVLTAKELNSNVFVATRAFSEKHVDKLVGAGANVVIQPEKVAGEKLAEELLGGK